MRNILNSFASMWILGGKLIVSESNMYNLISIITFIIALLTFILIRNMLDLDTKFKTFMNLKESIVFSNFYQIFACIQLCIINTLSLKNDLTFLESKYKYLIIITTTCMMLYILMFVFVNFSVRKFKYLKLSQRSQIISEQYQLQLEHYKRTEESYEMFRRFKHDFQGTINVMKSTLNKNHDMEGAFEVLESFEKVLSNQEWNRKVFSKNFVFDSMMQALVSKCKVNDITFNFEGVEPQHKLSLFDKVNLFYNLTSNAITAASQVNDVHKRFINLKIYNTDTWSTIQIENSYAGQIKYNNGVFTTTKEDNFNHGIGIASIREIIKRNGGVIKFTFNDYEKIFRVDVLLPRKSQK